MIIYKTTIKQTKIKQKSRSAAIFEIRNLMAKLDLDLRNRKVLDQSVSKWRSICPNNFLYQKNRKKQNQ